MLCQEPKTRYVIDGHDVCLDGRLAISHGDCVLDETVSFSVFGMKRHVLSGAIASAGAWYGAAARFFRMAGFRMAGWGGFRIPCFVPMAFASPVRRGVAWPSCPRIRLLLRLLQLDRD